MHGNLSDLKIDLFSTCPPCGRVTPADHAGRVREVARRSELAGCRGILVGGGDAALDPWLVSQLVIESTYRLVPLVAVRPGSMQPGEIATMVSSLGRLHGRRVSLCVEAGGPDGGRLLEFGTAFARLARHQASGDEALLPGIVVIGSPAAGLEVAQAFGATGSGGHAAGLRIGIVCRPSREEARNAARAASRAGLVGSYDAVAEDLGRFIAAGYRSFILDVPCVPEDLEHARLAFLRALDAGERGSALGTG